MGDTDGSFDLTTTVVSADGHLTKETWSADPRAEIDCFYLYPTVSRDTTTRSDMNSGDEERNVIRQQCARFASALPSYLASPTRPFPRGSQPKLEDELGCPF